MTFPVKKALAYIPQTPLGLKGKSFLGETLFTAPNPPFGAVFTYYLKDELKTKRKARLDAEKKADKNGVEIAYPTRAELRAEAREEDPAVVLTVTDAEGNVVRRLTGPSKAGFQRVAWDLRFPPANPTRLTPPPADNPFFDPPEGPLVVPGSYSVSFEKRVDGVPPAVRDPAELQRRVARPPDPEGGGRGGAAGVPEEDGAPAARGARRRRGDRGGADPPEGGEEGDRRHAGRRPRARRRGPPHRARARRPPDRPARRPRAGGALRGDADDHHRSHPRDRRRAVVGHRRADGHQPQGLRRRC